MARALTQKIQDVLTSGDIKVKYVFKVNGVDRSSYLTSWSIQHSKEYGSASATFSLHNDGGVFNEGGSLAISVGDVVSFSEFFGTDATEFKRFYGIVNQRSISKSADTRSIDIVCLDYISVLQFWSIDFNMEGTKVEVTDEILKPNFLPAPNDMMSQVYNFANENIAGSPKPVIMIKNKNNDTLDPAADGFETYYDVGQLKMGYPLNALYNYEVLCRSYWFYVKGLYVEDVIESLLTTPNAYGQYLFGEDSAQYVIDNHLTTTYLNTIGTSIDYLTPNYSTTTIAIKHQIVGAYTPDVSGFNASEITLDSVEGLPTNGTGSINGDMFSWSGITGNKLTGIPTTGTLSLSAKPNGSYMKYETDYAAGQVWYLSYTNLTTSLVGGNFTIPGTTLKFLDKRFGRIILNSPISTSATVTCNVNYTFKTLQATGVEINEIKFNSREVENRFEALKKLFGYLAPNYIVRTTGDEKIWANYLYQKVNEDYTLKLASKLSYLEDEDLYTRVTFYGKNKNPHNIMFGGDVSFATTGENYRATANNTVLQFMREEGNFYVFGSVLSGTAKITANTIKPIVYINGAAIDDKSHKIVAQAVIIQQTTTTTTSSGGGGMCFVTTAACKYFGKPDDCYELAVLRKFRDEWLNEQDGGSDLIRRYYVMAPAVVKALDVHPNKDQIYNILWNQYILRCVKLIEDGRFSETKDLYIQSITTLLDLDNFLRLHTEVQT
jgi:hypothetical protein